MKDWLDNNKALARIIMAFIIYAFILGGFFATLRNTDMVLADGLKETKIKLKEHCEKTGDETVEMGKITTRFENLQKAVDKLEIRVREDNKAIQQQLNQIFQRLPQR